MRIVFIGCVKFSQSMLEVLIEINANVIGVCTLESSEYNSDHVDLTEIAANSDIPVIYGPNINSETVSRWVANLAPDIIFCFGWSRLIQKELLSKAPMGVLGYHPSALPRNRGRHPIIWALALGLKKTGSTFFFMDEEPDSGDIVSQKTCLIDASDDAGSLYEKLTMVAVNQLKILVYELQTGTFNRLAQDRSIANDWRKRSKADGLIDWRMSAKSIFNLTRALCPPYSGASFVHKKQEFKLWKAVVWGDRAPGYEEPGKVIDIQNGFPIIQTGYGAVKLIEVFPKLDIEVGNYMQKSEK